MSFIRFLSGTSGTKAQGSLALSASSAASSGFTGSSAAPKEVLLSDYKDRPIVVDTLSDLPLIPAYAANARTDSPPLPDTCLMKPLGKKVVRVQKVSFSPCVEQISNSPAFGAAAGAMPAQVESLGGSHSVPLTCRSKTVIRLPRRDAITPASSAAAMSDRDNAAQEKLPSIIEKGSAKGAKSAFRATPAFIAKRRRSPGVETQDDSDDERVRALTRALAETRLDDMLASSSGKYLGNASESEER